MLKSKAVLELVGTIRGTGQHYTSGAERLEIWIVKRGRQRFLNSEALRVPVVLGIGRRLYTGGVSFTEDNLPIWINPDLKDSAGNPVSLTEALNNAGLGKNQKVVLRVEKWKIDIVPPDLFLS